MTRDELTVLVPVHESPTGGCYVRLRDIPNPWRSEFAYDSLGATLPAIAGEAEVTGLGTGSNGCRSASSLITHHAMTTWSIARSRMRS